MRGIACQKVAVLGSGTWGTAAAGLVACHAHDVVIWARSADVAEGISLRRRNPRHLPGYVLAPNVTSTCDRAEAVEGADVVVVAIPSQYLRATLEDFAGLVDVRVPLVVLTKGIEPGSHLLMTEVVADVLGGADRIAALSGPNHAEEICQNKIAAAVVASGDEALADLLQRLFFTPEFRVYRSSDLRGVEVCAAVKNVIAIACGICVGFGGGDNTLAALMTRGVAEMGRLVAAVGGDPMTCMGLAGMGDLVATCTSVHSRNRGFGEALAHGATLEGYERATNMVVEGARAALSVWELSCELGIETPITCVVHAMLYEDKPLDEALRFLLGRDPNKEFYGLDTNE